MSSEGSDALFGPWAATYAADRGTATSQVVKDELIRSVIEPGDLVLDLGCANGIHFASGRTNHARLVGLDHSEPMIAAARSSADGGGVPVLVGDACQLPFPDDTFDVLFSFGTLLLVPNLSGAIDEVARVVKPGGRVVFDIHNELNLSIHAWRLWYRRRGVPRLNAVTRRRFVRRLRRAGFDIEAMHASGLCDQWRYVPVLRRRRALDRVFHEGGERDRDYRWSNLPVLVGYAERWYVVARRRRPSGASPPTVIATP